MAGIFSNGSVYRIRQCALDLLSIVDLMDEEVSWDVIGRDLQLRSTFLYCDFKQIISKAAEDEKQPLINLANRLLCSTEEMSYAVKLKDSALMESRYLDTTKVLEDLMALLPYRDPFVEDESDD
ncbi:photosynthetic NDH subunit of lumenal location 3, chloroplastic-like [Papaver somniferum]|uniref:photosynthetic NDH subunit of lumenal location 3, chloroplastic-like n=1 Tax=Papaver somniferum TaxID=3469 RepID=UPI000E704287|nr:photosynthetic NDH subunit of lumenal location 3, chloroplastic-like [Papaver somniferum]XP_026438820.1 photosynthetic NDH subunit of lumenal location 3, chloroplastic-like [Papaver somniferum]